MAHSLMRKTLMVSAAVMIASGVGGIGVASAATVDPMSAVPGSANNLAVPTTVGDPVTTIGAIGKNYVELNQSRAAVGVAPVLPDPFLGSSAQVYSGQMASTGILKHGAYVDTAVHGLGSSAAGENILMNPNPGEANEQWANSPGHYANMVNPKFNRVGIGAAKGVDGEWYMTQQFAG